MNAIEFETYTDRLRSSVQSIPEVIGLVTLGSTAEPQLRDEWSDHDFWVITESDAQDLLIKDLRWLPDAHAIAIEVCHGPRRRTLVYASGHKIEFAIFDVVEAIKGKIQRYAVLIDRGNIADLMSSIQQDTLSEARLTHDRPDALENLCVLVWSACERHQRGELLSARQYLDAFSVNQLLSLLAIHDVDTLSDELDPRRHLESSSPKLAAEVLKVGGEPVPIAAVHLLDIALRELKDKKPDLAWEQVIRVKEWIGKLS